MPRRKQAKPQHVQSDNDWPLSEHNIMGGTHLGLATPPARDGRSCAAVGIRRRTEFVELSDLEQHHRDCSPNQLVPIVNENENENIASSAEMFPSASRSPPSTPEPEQTETIDNFEMEECSDLTDEKKTEGNGESMDVSSGKSSHSNLDSPSSSSSCKGSTTESITDIVSCTSVLPTSLPQPGNLSQGTSFSWFNNNSNVIIENLESTKVAVAQFSQQNRLDNGCSSSSKMVISSLMEQLLALQLQQIHQLQLIDQIRHQVLLFASQRSEVSETPSNSPQGTLTSKHANQLPTLSSHLSQQLAAAAGLAQSLASQSTSICHFKRLTATVQLPQSNISGGVTLSNTEPLQSIGKLITSSVRKQPSRMQSTHASSLYPKFRFSTTPTKMSSLALGTGSLLKSSNNPCLPQQAPCNQTPPSSTPSIGAIVEDLNALTVLTQQRAGKPPNVTSFEPKSFSEEAFFKHKCRFCAKVFGSDSALQIHLRSHTGERPYKCNICGNRFSTRGNLKVHFQRHKERYPHIQMNPYPVPEHLDNIPTSTGIPYGMSMSPEKPVSCWLDSKPALPTLTTSVGLLLPSGSSNLPFIIKKEEQPVSVTTSSSPCARNSSATVKTSKSTDFAEARKSTFSTFRLKTEDVKPPLNCVSKMSTKANTSTDYVPTDIPSISTNPIKLEPFKAKYNFREVLDPLQTSDTSQLQQLVENIDKKSTDPNECVLCHRILSCQSALKMHYRTHTGERPFRCKVCGRAFSTKGNLKTHHTIHRASPPLRDQHSCPICQRKFTNAVVLQQHIRMHMGGQIPNVALPDQSYSKLKESDSRLVEERKLEAQENYLSDDDMEDFHDSGIAGISRLNSSSGSLSPPCLQSPIMGAGSIDAHMQTSYGPVGEIQVNRLKTVKEAHFEEDCKIYNSSCLGDQSGGSLAVSDTTTYKQTLSSNKSAPVRCSPTRFEETYKAHINPSPQEFNVGVSPLDLKSLNQLKDPTNLIHTFHERGLFKNTACDICGKTFACQSALDIHYRSHTKERPFICTACNRGFSTKGNLKQHMLTHQMRDLPSQLFEPSNPSLASSPNPSIVFIGSPIIKTEINGFLNVNVYGDGRDHHPGSLRTSSAPMSPVLAAAPPTRRAPKQHYCHTCGKTFSSSSALQIHERTHTGEKPFACTVCGRAFTTKGNLKVHMGTHMWNSAHTRRGRRLSVDGPLVFMGAHPVKLPGPPQRTAAARPSNGDSLCLWNQRTDSLSKGLVVRTNDISVIQNGCVPYVSGPMGPVGQDKSHHSITEHNSPLLVHGKTDTESGTNFCFTRLIEERKEMIAN